jgi:diguanylate cyclase (GGDEF)-like protein
MLVAVSAVAAVTYSTIKSSEQALMERLNDNLESYVERLEERVLSEDYQPGDLLENIQDSEVPFAIFRRVTFWILPISCAFTVIFISRLIGFLDKRRLKKSKENLIQTQRLYLKSLSNTNTAFFDYDANNGQVIFSEMFAKRHGIPEAIYTNNHGLNSLEIEYQDHTQPFGSLLNEIKNASDISESTFRIESVDGELIWYSITATNIFNNKKILQRALALVRDIIDEKESAQALQRKAERDAMTGLYNKAGGIQHIADALQDKPDNIHALFVLDLDNFKKNNDTFGHAAGDTAIVDAARTISGLFRQSDILCRFGGDEFVAFIPNIHDIDFAMQKAEAIRIALKRSYGKKENEVNITSSIGIAVFPMHGQSYDELFNKADASLYKAKEKGKNTYVLSQNK